MNRSSAATPASLPDDPVLVRLWRGPAVESWHRGAWVLCDADGAVIDGAGGYEHAFFARSSVKCLQALPLVETGAAERFGFSEAELALALASHDGEPCHVEAVAATLARLGLGEADLRCGSHAPGSSQARFELRAGGGRPGRLHNNCSGKHAGFLALALHQGVPIERYLDPESASQALVRRAVLEMTGVAERDLTVAIDGCSAPTFRFPLTGLATAFARVANPEGLSAPRRAACERLLDAAAAHPELVAGTKGRLCTDVLRASRGRLFPKVGGEAVYAVGARGGGRALAVKIDDGGPRALHALVVRLVERFELASAAEIAALEPWRQRELRNHDGLAVGHTEVLA